MQRYKPSWLQLGEFLADLDGGAAQTRYGPDAPAKTTSVILAKHTTYQALSIIHECGCLTLVLLGHPVLPV